MQSNYRPLSNYIREVNIRDIDLSVSLLLGVSIQKRFIPSIANIIGTDMSTYKIIRRNQFAYGPVTSRNGDKISIALLYEYDKAIVSQAYTVFEITDTNKLLPEYLMMWFRRPEFDRYARYMSHGSAREIFDWDDMYNTSLPIPHIDKQRQIVAEYHTVVNRINLNKKLIQKLEEAAQAIYKQWFVDFEFPDENGQSYKNNGGEMVGSELGEIPKGWEVQRLDNIFNIKHGFAFEGEYIVEEENENILLTPGNLKIGGGFKGGSLKYYIGKFPKEYIFKSGAIMVTMTDLSKAADTIGYPAIIPEIKGKVFLHNQRLGRLIFKIDLKYFSYWLMRSSLYRNFIVGSVRACLKMPEHSINVG